MSVCLSVYLSPATTSTSSKQATLISLVRWSNFFSLARSGDYLGGHCCCFFKFLVGILLNFSSNLIFPVGDWNMFSCYFYSSAGPALSRLGKDLCSCSKSFVHIFSMMYTFWHWPNIKCGGIQTQAINLFGVVLAYCVCRQTNGVFEM